MRAPWGLRAGLAAGLLAVALLAVTGPARAGSFTVAPIRVSLPADGTAGVVRLRNLSEKPTLVQVQAFQWPEGTGTPPGPAPEILAVPPVFEVAGQAEQVIRLALRRPMAGEAERAYRLFLTEVPREAGAPPGAVAITLRLDLPVFVTPKGAAAAPVWSMRRGAGGAPELVLANRGSAHIRLQRIELLASAGAEPVATIEEPAYVLAGKERSWPLALSPAALGGPLEVRAETQLGGLEATVALSGG